MAEATAMAIQDGADFANPPIPLFSFEGLPGSGKTTQAAEVARRLSDVAGDSVFIDLPTDSPVGLVLKALYSDVDAWTKLSQRVPWFNPVMVTADLRLAVREAQQRGARFALMSRGILSTIYYNVSSYGGGHDSAMASIISHIRGFFRPTRVFFLNLPPEVAHQRVVARNRGPLRAMDKIPAMEKDREKLLSYLDFLSLPVAIIDANAPVNVVTDRIMQELDVPSLKSTS